MKSRVALSTLVLGVAMVLGTAADASAFGLFGGCGCCEPVCCEPTCCDPCARPCILSRLGGLLHRNHGCCDACCEPTCCAAEPTCCAAEPTCCAAEPTCCAAEPSCCVDSCCEPCCAPRCRLLEKLGGLFNRGCGCGCAASCCEPSCGCDAAPSCGCGM